MNRIPQAGPSEEQGLRESTPCAGGDPGVGERKGYSQTGGDRPPLTSMPPDRDIGSMPAPDVDRNQPFSPGLVGDSGVAQNNASTRTAADTMKVPGLPAPSHFQRVRHRVASPSGLLRRVLLVPWELRRRGQP